MKTFDELKQRLLDMEIEQERQDAELYWLSDLYEKVRELEALLAHIDSYHAQPVAERSPFDRLRNLEEINRIEAELAEMDDYKPQDDNETHYFEEIKRLRKTLSMKMAGLAEEVKPIDTKPSRPLEAKSPSPVAPGKTPDVKETSRIEAQLLRIDDYEPESNEELKYFKEIQNAKSQLKNPTAKAVPTNVPPKSVVKSTSVPKQPIQAQSPANKKKSSENEGTVTTSTQAKPVQQTKVQRGYVIRLMYDQRKLTEWSDESGGGWRECGKGQCYTDTQEVKKSLLKLKKRWPNYPLKIFKR